MNANKPNHEIRVSNIRVTIWKNPTDNGHRFSCTLDRSYKDEKTGEWKTSHVFGRDDLLVLSNLTERAFEWITEQPKDEPKA